MNALEVLEIKTMLQTVVSSLGKLESRIATPAETQLSDMDYRLRQARRKFLPDSLGDVAWDILLGLDRADRDQRQYFASDAAHESGIPLTTSLRYLAKMEQAGLIERLGDPEDRRKTLIALTTRGRDMLQNVFSSTLAAIDREHSVKFPALPVMIG